MFINIHSKDSRRHSESGCAVRILSRSVEPFPCVFVVSVQVRLQGDAPQLHLLFGAAGQTTGLLSFPGGAAGKQNRFRRCEFYGEEEESLAHFSSAGSDIK